ncbi:MAG: hypothetical protein KAX78_02330, partial [Phycisphaerae bacterium]|nr:hypothetical protein [Phycisphaerae bacterium]
YGAKRTGQYRLVNLKAGTIVELKLSANSTVLAIDDSRALAREGDRLYVIPHQQGGAQRKRMICQREAVRFVRYAICVRRKPQIKKTVGKIAETSGRKSAKQSQSVEKNATSIPTKGADDSSQGQDKRNGGIPTDTDRMIPTPRIGTDHGPSG